VNPALSLYLDAVRVLAACVVVLCHFGSRRVSGGVLWQAAPYGAEAVDVFFVLSGFVIAYAASARETTAAQFAWARAARLYSVALPALVLTLVLDGLGVRLYPQAYASFPGVIAVQPKLWWQAAAGLSFLNAGWLTGAPVGANVPWWSLGFEAPFYAGFGLAVFARGAWRWGGLLALAALVGPGVVLVAPAWIFGVLVWRARAVPMPRAAAAGLAVLGLLVWAGYELGAARWGRGMLSDAWTQPGLLRGETPQDLVVAACFALHLLGMARLLRGAAPAWLAVPIRFAAARSFSLYLYHFPLLMCLRAAMLRVCPDRSPLWLLPVTLLCVAGLAQVTELQRGRLRRWRPA